MPLSYFSSPGVLTRALLGLGAQRRALHRTARMGARLTDPPLIQPPALPPPPWLGTPLIKGCSSMPFGGILVLGRAAANGHDH